MELKFGDKVRVKSGFYEGIEGIVVEQREFSNTIVYEIEGSKELASYWKEVNFIENEDNLDKIED